MTNADQHMLQVYLLCHNIFKVNNKVTKQGKDSPSKAAVPKKNYFPLYMLWVQVASINAFSCDNWKKLFLIKVY